MNDYVYTPLENPGSQIRLLTIPWSLSHKKLDRMYEPLNGRLSDHYLPGTDFAPTQRLFGGFRLPAFIALSYVWGDPTPSHEIFIDGRRLLITANLHAVLWRLHIDSITDIIVWADAICINQEDLAEKSAQIPLMRQVYHLAASVRVCLGIGKRESSRCMQFIACITGSRQAQISPYLAREEKANPDAPVSRPPIAIYKIIILLPIGLLLGIAGRALIGLGRIGQFTLDVLASVTKDNKKKLLPISDESYQKTLDKLIAWQPTTQALRKAQKMEGDFGEMANLINRWLILNPDWFRRMWVVQELGTANSVFIQCGRCSVTWTDFLHTVCYLDYTCSHPVKDISRVTGLEQIHAAWKKGNRPPLQDLMRECCHRRATNPRDKIYALLGLVGDSMNDCLRPDYTKSVGEVYANTARNFINQTKSLNPICGHQTQGRREDLPSWVPDFELDQTLAPSPLVNGTGNEQIFSASGHDKKSKYSLLKRKWKNKELPLLYVRGIILGVVSSMSVVVGQTKDTLSDSAEKRWHRTLVLAGSLLGPVQESTNPLRELSRLLHEYIEVLVTTDPPPIRGTTLNEPFHRDLYSINSDEIVAAFIQTLLCGRFTSRTRLSDNDVVGIARSFTVHHPLEYLDSFPSAFESGIRRRRLIVTETGHLGAAPAETQLSDLVCILFCCNVPVVLRLLPNESKLRFIGEFYVHGFMDGEAMAGLETGSFTARDFALK